jgi:hypothetical protein
MSGPTALNILLSYQKPDVVKEEAQPEPYVPWKAVE